MIIYSTIVDKSCEESVNIKEICYTSSKGAIDMIIVRLDRVMADRKMSLRELSSLTGLSEVNLSKLKNSHVKAIRFSTLNAICTHLKCQPRDILEFVYDI